MKIFHLPFYKENRVLITAFLVFLLYIGVENQCHMRDEITAFQNDAFIAKLREAINKEFLAYTYGIPGALDVRAMSRSIRLVHIIDRLNDSLPRTLHIEDGVPGNGILIGLGHPFLGGRAERTVWRLIEGRDGGSLELEATPYHKEAQVKAQ